MGETAVALRYVLPGAWLRAVERAPLSRGARRLARLLASLPKFPYAFPSLRRLGQALDVEHPLSPDQVRRYVRELERAGLLTRTADYDRREDGGDGRQTSNMYESVVNVPPATTNARGPLASCQGLSREKYKRRLSLSPGKPDLKATAEPSRTHASAPAREPPPPALAATAATAAPSKTEPAKTKPQTAPDRPTPTERGATRPEKLGKGQTVPDDVVEALSRLTDGADAARVLASAGLTEAEQRRVLARVLAYGPRSAGAYIRCPIRDVLAERDRAAEAQQQVAWVPPLEQLDDDALREVERTLRRAWTATATLDPEKAKVVRAKLDEIAAWKRAQQGTEYVPDGGAFPEPLREPPGHLAPRRAPPPRDPLRDALSAARHRLGLMSASHPGRPKQEAEVARLEAQLARPAARGGLRLVESAE